MTTGAAAAGCVTAVATPSCRAITVAAEPAVTEYSASLIAVAATTSVDGVQFSAGAHGTAGSALAHG